MMGDWKEKNQHWKITVVGTVEGEFTNEYSPSFAPDAGDAVNTAIECFKEEHHNKTVKITEVRITPK